MSPIGALLQTPHTFAIVGASPDSSKSDSSKYGYEDCGTLVRHGHGILPVDPKSAQIDCRTYYSSLPDLPWVPEVVVTAAPAAISAEIAEGCTALGVPFFWTPPGTETDAALEIFQRNGVTAIHGFCPVFVLNTPPERRVELP